VAYLLIFNPIVDAFNHRGPGEGSGSRIVNLSAGLMTMSFMFLAYSAYVVPMQLSFWAHREACDPFPTISFDLVVDTYFMVRGCHGTAIHANITTMRVVL
jgi:hypothetical protein